MVRPRLGGQRQVGAYKRRPKLGNQLLGRIRLVAEPAPQVAGAPARVPGQVRRLVRQGGIVAMESRKASNGGILIWFRLGT